MSFQFNKTTELISLIKYWMRSNLRSYSKRGYCPPDLNPKCSKETLAKTKMCPSKRRRLERGEKLPKTRTIWEDAECCPEPCPEYVARTDELYYSTSNKEKRKYQQTWIECPKLEIRAEKVCDHECFRIAPMEKRIIKRKPLNKCHQSNGVPRVCLLPRRCIKLVLPKCHATGNKPPSCKKFTKKAECEKMCAPYPSYSESIREAQAALHPKECKCLDHQMMCRVWAKKRRLMACKGDEEVNKMLGRASSNF